MREVVVFSGFSTAIGTFGGSFKAQPPTVATLFVFVGSVRAGRLRCVHRQQRKQRWLQRQLQLSPLLLLLPRMAVTVLATGKLLRSHAHVR